MELWGRLIFWTLAIYGFWCLGALLWERVVWLYLKPTRRPFISFLLLVKDGEEHLEVWIRDLAALLERFLAGVARYELVIVDQASGDQTPQILDRLAQRWPNLRTLRLSATPAGQSPVEVGVFLCQSQLVLLLDLQDKDSFPRLLSDLAGLFQARTRSYLVP